MTQEEKNVWDGYFAAALTGLLAKPGNDAGGGPLAALSATPQAKVGSAANFADLMLAERKKR
ncbi:MULTISPECIES: hypothetical protein [Pseudomonas]|uniref:hypothetical protein n=1 Tax=Pseudomonas TaxID=286 RepID=UPI00114288E1|nr:MULTISPECIES: hypothetical protein [Pseudomonas]MBP1085387.1 hypothetical protein [Pseudomonas sp. PvP007]MBP1193576.1 hypothetical protein [Pseudomonas sp. PvP100]